MCVFVCNPQNMTKIIINTGPAAAGCVVLAGKALIIHSSFITAHIVICTLDPGHMIFFSDMDTDFTDGLMVNPSDVKVEPASPSSSAPPLIPLVSHAKLEPDVVVKQETQQPQQHVAKAQHSVLKHPTIVITNSNSGVRTSSNTARLLVPKLPSNTTVKLESGERWRIGTGSTKILVSGTQTNLKSSARRTIDSHLISSSNNTVRHCSTFPHFLTFPGSTNIEMLTTGAHESFRTIKEAVLPLLDEGPVLMF